MRVTILSLLTLLQALTVVSLSISSPQDTSSNPQLNQLFKRKGGGGGGRSSGSSGGTSSSGASSGGRTTGGVSGGTTASGSGARPSYGSGGAYYGGGARVPFAAGGTSARGLSPIGFYPVAALGFFGGAWLAGAYLYSYSNPYRFYNASSQRNETKPVDCLCQDESVCGCDDPEDDSLLNSIIGNGSYSSLNSSLVRVADVNGTSTILINGTLPDDTTAAGAVSAALGQNAQRMGWAVMAAAVACAMMTL